MQPADVEPDATLLVGRQPAELPVLVDAVQDLERHREKVFCGYY